MLAQTTDLGSNNNTMASHMYDLLNDGDGSTETGDFAWDPTTMHIWCICHKLALIVNAGLAALSLKTLPPGKAKESVLGFFPVLGQLTEEEEPEEPASAAPHPTNCVEVAEERNNGTVALNVESNADYSNANDEALVTGEDSGAHPGENDPADNNLVPNTLGGANRKYAKSTKLKDLTNKVHLFFKSITLYLIR
jgi:hypothetical protein